MEKLCFHPSRPQSGSLKRFSSGPSMCSPLRDSTKANVTHTQGSLFMAGFSMGYYSHVFLCLCTCLLMWSSQADSSCVAMFLRVTTTPLGMLSTALKWSSYSSLAILFTFCFVFSSLDFSFLPRFPVQPVTNSEPAHKQDSRRLLWFCLKTKKMNIYLRKFKEKMHPLQYQHGLIGTV